MTCFYVCRSALAARSIGTAKDVFMGCSEESAVVGDTYVVQVNDAKARTAREYSPQMSVALCSLGGFMFSRQRDSKITGL